MTKINDGKTSKVGRKSKSELKIFETKLFAKLKEWKDREDYKSCDEVPGINEDIFSVDSNCNEISFPSTLSAGERKVVHSVALQLELYHASVGEGNSRYIQVSRSVLSGENKIEGLWYNPEVIKQKVSHKYFDFSSVDRERIQRYIKETKITNFSLNIIIDITKDLSQEPTDLNECIIINTIEELQNMAHILSTFSIIAFDCEMHNQRSYYGIICCIQFSNGVNEFLVDCLSLWDQIGPTLGPIFSSSHIVKVGHGISSGDISCLFRDFGIYVINAFDIQRAAFCLEISSKSMLKTEKVVTPENQFEADQDINNERPIYEDQTKHVKRRNLQTMSLANLLKHFHCPLATMISDGKEKMKMTDWRTRPFTGDMIRYARLDVYYLIPLYHILMVRLLATNGDSIGDARSSSIFQTTTFLQQFTDEEEEDDDDDDDDENEGQVEVIPQDASTSLSNTTITTSSTSPQSHHPLNFPKRSVGHFKFYAKVNRTDIGIRKGEKGTNMNVDKIITCSAADLTLSSSPSAKPSNDTMTRILVKEKSSIELYTSPLFAMVAEAMEQSRELCMELWSPPEGLMDGGGGWGERDDVAGWQRVCKAARVVKKRGPTSLCKDWNDTNELVLRHLVLWRDRSAKYFDENPAYIAATGHLLSYAKFLPCTVNDLILLISPLPPFLAEDSNRVTELLEVIAKSKQLAIEERNRAEEEAAKKNGSNDEMNKKETVITNLQNKTYFTFLSNKSTIVWVLTLGVATVFVFNFISFRRRR